MIKSTTEDEDKKYLEYRKKVALDHFAQHSPYSKLSLEDALIVMNKNYGLWFGVNKPVIIEIPTQKLWKREDFHLKLSNARYDKRSLDQHWIEWEGRREFVNFGFWPGKKETENEYNLFRGFDVKPLNEEFPEQYCSLYLEHVEKNICNNNAVHHQYLIQWLAHLFQKPGDKLPVAVCLRGQKGTGKSIFAKVLRTLVGQRHSFETGNREQLIGKFNNALEAKLLFIGEKCI